MPHRHTALAIVFATVCIDLLGFGMVLPLLPIYAEEIAAKVAPQHSDLILMGLMTCFSLMQFLFAPLLGRISDRVGRRPVLLFSLTGSAVFYLLFGLAMMWRSLTWVFVSRIGAGIAGATIPTAQAYIADVTPRERRTRGMALIGAAFGLGFTFGPLIGALALIGSGDAAVSPWPGFAAALLSMIALVVAVFKLPESLPAEAIPESRTHLDLRSLGQALAIPSIGLLLLTGALAVVALASLESTISLTIKGQLEDAGQGSGIGHRILLVFAYIGLIQSVVQGFLVRRLALVLSEATLGFVGVGISIAGFALLAIVAGAQHGSLVWLVAAVGVVIAGIGFLMPAIQSLISRRSDPAEQGGILGLSESLASMSRIVGKAIGIYLFFRATSAPSWTAAAIMALVLGLLAVAIRRGTDWQPEPEAA